MIKNMRIPRYKTIFPDSEISDGTTPVYADSEARPERFVQKRNFISGRADKNLYFPSLTFGRGHSDASRRFVTWGIEIYNQIKGLSILKVKNCIALHIFPILTFGREDSNASRRFVTRGIEIYNQIIMNTFPVSRNLMMIQETAGGRAAPKLAFPAGGAGRPPPLTWAWRGGGFPPPHLRRLTHWGRRRCGNAWSLRAMTAGSIENI